MGSPQSKIDAPKAVNTQTNMVEESTGSHFIEIHSPTAGVGFFTIFAILLAFKSIFGLYRKCKRHTQRRPQLPSSTFQGMAFPNQPYPMQTYCQLLILQQLRDQRELPSRNFYQDTQRFTLLDEERIHPTLPNPNPLPRSSCPVCLH